MMGAKAAETCGWISGYDKSTFHQREFVGLGPLYKCKYFLMHGYGTLPHSQVPASTCPYPEQINSVHTPPPPLHFLNIPLNIVLPSTASSYKLSIFFWFSHQKTICNFPVKLMRNMHRPSWFGNRNNAVTGAQVKISIIHKRSRKCNCWNVYVCVYVNWDRILGLRVYEPGLGFGVCVNKLRLTFYSSLYTIYLFFGFFHETCCIKHHRWDIAVGLKRKHARNSYNKTKWMH